MLLVKVAHTRSSSVGFRSWSQFFCSQPAGDVSHKPGGRLALLSVRQACSYLRNPSEGCYLFCCLVNRGTMGVNSLPKTITRQRRDCDLNPGPSAPESSTLTTRLPSCFYKGITIDVIKGLVTKLCSLVSKMDCLQELDLSRNLIGDFGALFMIDALRQRQQGLNIEQLYSSASDSEKKQKQKTIYNKHQIQSICKIIKRSLVYSLQTKL